VFHYELGKSKPKFADLIRGSILVGNTITIAENEQPQENIIQPYRAAKLEIFENLGLPTRRISCNNAVKVEKIKPVSIIDKLILYFEQSLNIPIKIV